MPKNRACNESLSVHSEIHSKQSWHVLLFVQQKQTCGMTSLGEWQGFKSYTAWDGYLVHDGAWHAMWTILIYYFWSFKLNSNWPHLNLLHCKPHSNMHTHIHAGFWRADTTIRNTSVTWEAGVQYLIQEHFNMLPGGVGDQTISLLLTRWPATPEALNSKYMLKEGQVCAEVC